MTLASRRKKLFGLLGDLPARKRRVTAQLLREEQTSLYRLERLLLDTGGPEPIPALATLPLSGEPPYPAVLFSHSHGGFYRLGKRELLEGNVYLANPPYADALAERGIACFAIDHLNFGERHRQAESELFKELLWRGQVQWGSMVFDSLAALDYLARRPDIDTERIGALGISMGSTMSYWTAALDERVRVVVELCCLTDWDELIASRGLDEHGVYYYVPGLLKHFTTAELLELVAPRPFLSLSGNQDPLTPPRGLDKLDAAMKKAYRARGAAEAWKMLREDHGHFETETMRRRALEWLERWL
jgi:dienelactone hydrolase